MVKIISVRPPDLALHSCEYKQIDNERISEISTWEANQFKKFDEDYGSGVNRRSDPNPFYNCHGMTFATRRTGVFETAVVRQILDEDKYGEVPQMFVLPGDVILYYGPDNDIEHSGIVIEVPKPENFNVPLVCSKWGKYAELVHWGNQCPYNFANVKYYRMNYVGNDWAAKP
jgi:hypothetical protein